MTNIDEHIVGLKFYDFDYSPEELTKKLGLEPTKTTLKGQEYFIGPEHKRVKKTWSYNIWTYQSIEKKNNHWIGDQIDNFIDNIIKPRQNEIKEINKTCKSEFSIVQYIHDGCNPGLHFDRERLKIISDIGVEIDADIYVLGNGNVEKQEIKTNVP